MVSLKKKADIAPGQTGAILTLANGKKLVLDSAGNGLLAQQAGVNVLQQNGQLAYNGQSQAVLYNTMSTPVGRTFRLVLPDGTRVWLNASSSITFPTAFEGKERQVTITGEAYFEVVHRVTQKFLVKTGNETVEDIGTKFDIDSYSDEPSIKTTLLEGAVRVAASGNTATLHPGDQAVLSASVGKITIDKDVDLDEVIAWKNGVFRFNSVDIHTIMRQAARWYDMEVSYEGDIHETFSGGISRNVNVSQLFHILGSTDKVSFEINGKKIIVKPKK
jgi:ferric-dicitrate binding protein FerR (iron transport regulator)